MSPLSSLRPRVAPPFGAPESRGESTEGTRRRTSWARVQVPPPARAERPWPCSSHAPATASPCTCELPGGYLASPVPFLGLSRVSEGAMSDARSDAHCPEQGHRPVLPLHWVPAGPLAQPFPSLPQGPKLGDASDVTVFVLLWFLHSESHSPCVSNFT